MIPTSDDTYSLLAFSILGLLRHHRNFNFLTAKLMSIGKFETTGDLINSIEIDVRSSISNVTLRITFRLRALVEVDLNTVESLDRVLCTHARM
jgi:hypothetical protein